MNDKKLKNTLKKKNLQIQGLQKLVNLFFKNNEFNIDMCNLLGFKHINNVPSTKIRLHLSYPKILPKSINLEKGDNSLTNFFEKKIQKFLRDNGVKYDTDSSIRKKQQKKLGTEFISPDIVIVNNQEITITGNPLIISNGNIISSTDVLNNIKVWELKTTTIPLEKIKIKEQFNKYKFLNSKLSNGNNKIICIIHNLIDIENLIDLSERFTNVYFVMAHEFIVNPKLNYYNY